MRTTINAITTTGNAWQTVTIPAGQVKPGQRIRRISVVGTSLSTAYMERRSVCCIYMTLGSVGQTVRLNLTELRLFGAYECVYWEGDMVVDAQEQVIGVDFVCPTAGDAIAVVVDYE